MCSAALTTWCWPQELDKEFPANPLFPTEPELAEQAEALSAAAEELSKAGYR